MKYSFNCSAFVKTKANPFATVLLSCSQLNRLSRQDTFINREVIAENIEQAKEKFNKIIEQYSFVSIDVGTTSVKLKA